MIKYAVLGLLFISSNVKLEGKSPYDYSNYKATNIDINLFEKISECINDGESAIYITKSGVSFIKVEIKKSGDYTGDITNTQFYGVNSAVLVQSGKLKMTLGNITTTAKGGNAVVATNGGIVHLTGTNIKSTGESAKGFLATYGGKIAGTSLIISTNGSSSASLCTDKEYGTIYCTICSLSTEGVDSPLIYSTGDINLITSNGIASKSQAIVIEGKNKVKIISSNLKCGANPFNGKNNECGVFIYQSIQIEESSENSIFEIIDSTIEILPTSIYYETAPMFYITNTVTNIKLTNSILKFGSKIFMKIDKGEWGNSGKNGGKAVVTLKNMDIEGNITVGSTSTLTLNLFGTKFKGTINGNNICKKVDIFIDKESTITLTGNSYANQLTNQLKKGNNLINGTYAWNPDKVNPSSPTPTPTPSPTPTPTPTPSPTPTPTPTPTPNNNLKDCSLPDWLKDLINEALRTSGKETAIALCKKYMGDAQKCNKCV